MERKDIKKDPTTRLSPLGQTTGEKTQRSYTLQELKALPDYESQLTLRKKQERRIIPFGNLDMLGNLSDREQDDYFNPSASSGERPNWTVEKNIAFMAAAIQDARTFRLVTPLASYNNHCKNGELSGTMCEILLLLDHGYEMKPDEHGSKKTIFFFRGGADPQKRSTPFENYWLPAENPEKQAARIARFSSLITERAQMEIVRNTSANWRGSQDKNYSPNISSENRRSLLSSSSQRRNTVPGAKTSIGTGPSETMPSFGDNRKNFAGQRRLSSTSNWREDRRTNETSDENKSTTSAPKTMATVKPKSTK